MYNIQLAAKKSFVTMLRSSRFQRHISTADQTPVITGNGEWIVANIDTAYYLYHRLYCYQSI